jgi:hypothetical protein
MSFHSCWIEFPAAEYALLACRPVKIPH